MLKINHTAFQAKYNGDIKICPAMPSSYGNINTDSIGDIISKTEFQRWWKIKKDNIKICQDCEYRYICSDCRINNFDDEKTFNKPVKCSYDPYEAVWLEENIEK